MKKTILIIAAVMLLTATGAAQTTRGAFRIYIKSVNI